MLERTMRALRSDPVLFVEEILGAMPDPWQAEALKALANNPYVAVRSGHGVGKSAVQVWGGQWFLFTHLEAKVITTAPTMRQLYDVFMSECTKWLKRSPLLSELFDCTKSKVAFKGAPAEWFLVARTAARPENLAGFHADNLLFILDEASGIDDAIFETVLGALTGTNNKLLMCSNPTRNSGFFHRAFFEDRDLFYTMKISSLDSPRVNQNYYQRLVKQYGADSDVVRVRVLGEFPAQEAAGLIPLELVEAAMAREPDFDGELILGVDLARFGDDETVIAARLGDSVLPLQHWRKLDLMQTTGKILHTLTELMTKYKIGRARLNVDEGGLGAGVVDRLREVCREKNLFVTVNGCNFGGKARDKKYANFVTEAYFALRDRLAQGAITLPNDDELAAQLSTRRYNLTSSDTLIIEKKADFKKRIGRSPDRADAVLLAFAPTLKITTIPDMPMQMSRWKI